VSCSRHDIHEVIPTAAAACIVTLLQLMLMGAAMVLALLTCRRRSPPPQQPQQCAGCCPCSVHVPCMAAAAAAEAGAGPAPGRAVSGGPVQRLTGGGRGSSGAAELAPAADLALEAVMPGGWPTDVGNVAPGAPSRAAAAGGGASAAAEQGVGSCVILDFHCHLLPSLMQCVSIKRALTSRCHARWTYCSSVCWLPQMPVSRAHCKSASRHGMTRMVHCLNTFSSVGTGPACYISSAHVTCAPSVGQPAR
jgi:hypothetical protein